MSCVSQRITVFLIALLALGSAVSQSYAQGTVTLPPPSTAPLAIPNAVPSMPADAGEPMASPPAFSETSVGGPQNNPVTVTTMPGVASPTPVLSTVTTPAKPDSNIPKVVTSVVDDLRNAEKNVSLDDMARAQDALTRLDLLLEIERRINDIEKARDERKSIGRSSGRMADIGTIPASALNLPVTPVSSNVNIRPTPAVVAPPVERNDYTVEQIAGINGSYRAVLANGSGKRQTVTQGEKVGSWTVQKISATGVTLSGKSGSKKTLTVETNGAPVVIRPR
ncbi:MAG: hypothetical protein AB7G06_01855 [Bdellovibrionales bacterium]